MVVIILCGCISNNKNKWKLSQLREKLAGVYEAEEEFLEAAQVLQSIQLDSGHR